MAMRYRNQNVVIEATQWFQTGDHPMVRDHDTVLGAGVIDTVEGPRLVVPGDWIITGADGEHYPCKPDIFALTYKPAEQE